ncbi:hypothetical protein V8C42DRAFT_357049 [Trichoderma barbatum]
MPPKIQASPNRETAGRSGTFQIESSLARYDSARDTLEKGKMPCPTLGARHFDLVARAIEKFGTYMEHATGGADSDHARIEGTRADEVIFNEDKPSKSSSSAVGNRMKVAQVDIPRSQGEKPRERSYEGWDDTNTK